ncbi:MAG TPA: hypothetical protein VE439_00825, partial [Anaerolineae bacterium]|nr:hypothetical protein [Anaerolineae bacterium]
MRLKLLMMIPLLAILGSLLFAPCASALPNEVTIGLTTESDCENCHFMGENTSTPLSVQDVMFAMPIEETSTPILNGQVEAIW